MKQTLTAADPRTLQFREIAGALKLPGVTGWDLNWGEPFIAVSSDRKTWVRIFYEESAPLSSARFEHETERFLPLIPADGNLVFCIPQAWGLTIKDVPAHAAPNLKFWVHRRGENSVEAYEMPEKAAAAAPVCEAASEMFREERLEADEIRQLAEIGLVLKRNQLKKAS